MFQSKIRTITPWYVFYPSVTLAHFKLSLSTLVHNCWIPGFDHSGITRLRSMEDPWKLTVGTYTAIYSYFVKYFSLEKTAVIRIYWFDMIYSFCCVVLHLLWTGQNLLAKWVSFEAFLSLFFLKKRRRNLLLKAQNIQEGMSKFHCDLGMKMYF